MSTIIILALILLGLMTYVGNEKGLNSFLTLLFNFFILYILFANLTSSKNPITLTLIFCGVMSAITLFTLNGFHKKTFTAFLSVVIVILTVFGLITAFSYPLNIQGFDYNQYDSIEYLSKNIDLSFQKIVVCEILIAVFSAITDTAMSVSSSMNEIFQLNSNITKKDLYKSGMNIGSDILGTTVNTLFFVYFGNLLIILIWFMYREADFETIINSKLLADIIFDIVISGISVILVIPISAFLTSQFLRNKKAQS